jgi:Flp pilus assembly pilin Flp
MPKVSWRSEAGQSLAEYTIIVGGIAVACAFVVLFLSTGVGGIFGSPTDPATPGSAFTPPVHSSPLPAPSTLEDCEDNGWQDYPQFISEEGCVAYVQDA